MASAPEGLKGVDFTADGHGGGHRRDGGVVAAGASVAQCGGSPVSIW